MTVTSGPGPDDQVETVVPPLQPRRNRFVRPMEIFGKQANADAAKHAGLGRSPLSLAKAVVFDARERAIEKVLQNMGPESRPKRRSPRHQSCIDQILAPECNRIPVQFSRDN